MISYNTGNYSFSHSNVLTEHCMGIIDLGLESRNSRQYYFDNSKRDYPGYLIQYTLKGCGCYQSGGVDYALPPGTGFFTRFPENSFYFYPGEEQAATPWEFLYLHFGGPFAEVFYERIRQVQGPVFSLDSDSKAIASLLTFYNLCGSSGERLPYDQNQFLYSFLTMLLRESEFPSHRQGNPHVSRLTAYIESNFASDISLSHGPDHKQLSYEHLCRLFTREKGMSPVAYLTGLRIEKSIRLLIDSTLGLEAIASACGFQNANYFGKVFKKYMQVSPGEYRRIHGK